MFFPVVGNGKECLSIAESTHIFSKIRSFSQFCMVIVAFFPAENPVVKNHYNNM
jgi:hypothetical protein